MDPERPTTREEVNSQKQTIDDAIVKAKAGVIKSLLEKLDGEQFAITTLIALRELKKEQCSCIGGCEHIFNVSDTM
jgi:hypothetical protein